MIINRCRPQYRSAELLAAVPKPLRRPHSPRRIPSSTHPMTRCPLRRSKWLYPVNLPRAQLRGSALLGIRFLLQRVAHPSSSANFAVKPSNPTCRIHLMKPEHPPSPKDIEPLRHCSAQREEARAPSTARRISGISCFMTRASSSKARACDTQFSVNNFRSRQLREGARDQRYPTFHCRRGCADLESKLFLPDGPVVAGGEYAMHPTSRT